MAAGSAENSTFLKEGDGSPYMGAVSSHSDGNQGNVYSFALSTTEPGNGRKVSLKSEGKTGGIRNYLGILLALFAGFVFTIGTILVKFLKHYHAFTLALFRIQGIFVPSMLMVLYCIKVKKIPIFEPILPLCGTDRKWRTFIKIILRAAIGCTALFFHFYALQYMTVADVAVINSCKPIFVTVAAFLFLGETCGFFPVILALLTMVGVVVITRPPLLTGEEEFDKGTLIGTLFAMACVLTDTFVVVIVRSLKHIHVAVMMLFLGCWGTLQSVVCAYAIGELRLPETGQDWALAGGIAAVGLINQVAMNLALQCEQANPVAVTRTMDFIFAFVLQFFVLGVVPDLFSLSGAAIIICCVLLIAFRKWLNTLPPSHKSRKRFWFVLT